MSDADNQAGEPTYRVVIDFADAPPGILEPTQRGALALLGPVLHKFREFHPGIRVQGSAYPLSLKKVVDAGSIPVARMKKPYVLQFMIDWAQVRSVLGTNLARAVNDVIVQKVRETGTKDGDGTAV